MSHKKGIGAVPKFADLTLSDRADGVKGHYCVGFTDEQGTRWSWNKADGGHFGAYGTLIVGEEAALALLAALQKAHNVYTAGTNTIETYRESEARLNQLLTEASAPTAYAQQQGVPNKSMQAAPAPKPTPAPATTFKSAPIVMQQSSTQSRWSSAPATSASSRSVGISSSGSGSRR